MNLTERLTLKGLVDELQAVLKAHGDVTVSAQLDSDAATLYAITLVYYCSKAPLSDPCRPIFREARLVLETPDHLV